MQTEYAEQMVKDFDRNAMNEIIEALDKRAEWCRTEYRERADGGNWSLQDAADLATDAATFEGAARALSLVMGVR